MKINTLQSSTFNTPFGTAMVIADDTALYFLEFSESLGFQRRLERFEKKVKANIISGNTPITESIKKELKQYFEGKLKEFKTPLALFGTPFQKQVWDTLRKIPWGSTLSYAALAEAVGNPKACRAVANANARNHIAIVIPCHRVIQANGLLGGYGGGQDKKQKLLHLEGAHYYLD